ncbi:MAG: discoidin domain-containing protein [Planctomycetes bacterium]|jgi:hypothetical protein|nr:discoidin domain-containing protein [Planctomycetota bacterium]
MWKKHTVHVVVGGVVLMFASVLSAPAGAEVLFSDDFAYANKTYLSGIGGWTATDATAHWALNDDGLGDGGTNSLQYPGVPSRDGRLYVRAGSGSVNHALSRPVTGEGNCLYASFLYKPLGIPGTYWFQLDTTGSIQGQLGRIDGKGANGQVELGCRMRTATVLSKKPLPLGQTAFVVMKVTMVAGSNNDTVQLWVNPPVGVPEPTADATAIAETGNDINPVTGILGFSFRVGQSNVGEKEVDWIRLGTTWEDVAGYPYLDAQGPAPKDGAQDVPRDAVLSWSPGQLAQSHDVYFGTDLQRVSQASRTAPLGVLVSQAQDANTYDPPGALAVGQTYYWRIDEVQGSTIHPGKIWSFVTEALGYPLQNVTAAASSSFASNTGPEKTIGGAGLTDDLHATAMEQMWLSSAAGPTPAWIQYRFDRVYRLQELWIWNSNQTIEPAVGVGAKDVLIEYSADGSTWTALGEAQFARAPGTPGYAHNTTVDLKGIVAQYVRLTIKSSWGGMLTQCGLSEVRFFYMPVWAREPNPASGATVVNPQVTLRWRAGREASSHAVYVSTDREAVRNGTAPAVTVAEPRYETSADLGRSYYWKVVEVNDAQTPKSWEGDVWSFTTTDTLVVDDFESYTDQDGAQVFSTWIDGLTDNFKSNGSTVGLATARNGTFCETTIFHGGRQSMPFAYDNTKLSLSEATRTFDPAQDWTAHGIKGLSLWFYGDPNNVAQQMYVKVNNIRIPYDGDVLNLQRRGWQTWYIDLTSNSLRNVTKLSIGFDRLGGVGGQGKVFVDDIRLTSHDRQLITPVAPDASGLQVRYQFESNANDSVAARHLTVTGKPQYAAGKVGQAILLNGATDFATVESSFDLPVYSATLWFRVEGGLGQRNILSIYDSAGGHGILAEIGSDGAFRFLHRFPFGASGGTEVRSTFSCADGTWYHAALVKAPEAMTLYLNGMPAGSATDMTRFDLALARLTIGVLKHDSPSRFFPGAIDEVRLYHRVLSAGEIAALAGLTMPYDQPF